MAKKETDASAELDEHGLVVHRYVSTVLVVIPAHGYDEVALRYARSALFNVHVGTFSVSSNDEDLIHGHLQDELQADGKLSEARMEGHSGLILTGGPGVLEMAENPDAVRLVKEAAAADKLIGTWGEAVGLLARAGVVTKRKVTGAPSQRKALEAAGGRFTGRQVQVDRNFVTAVDESAGFRFGKELARIVAI